MTLEKRVKVEKRAKKARMVLRDLRVLVDPKDKVELWDWKDFRAGKETVVLKEVVEGEAKRENQVPKVFLESVARQDPWEALVHLV